MDLHNSVCACACVCMCVYVLRLVQEVCFEWTHVDIITACDLGDDSSLLRRYTLNMLFTQSVSLPVQSVCVNICNIQKHTPMLVKYK